MEHWNNERVIDIARGAGELLVKFNTVEVPSGSDPFPKTAADAAAHALLERELSRFGIPFVSEENNVPVPKEGYAWVVDPLDGTSDFIANNKDWCVMIALIHDAVPVGGMVYAPRYDTFWFGSKGNGAYVLREGNESRLQVSSVSNLPDSTGLTSRMHASQKASDLINRVGAKQRVVGSIGIKLGVIAEGEAEFYWNDAALGVWDVAAASAILSEAGGKVTDIHGGRIIYTEANRRISAGILATNGQVHPALVGQRP